jgi:hypothetical protein
VKTTVEIPGPVLRDAKAAAARRGVPLTVFLTEALREKLGGAEPGRTAGWPVPPPKIRKGEARRIQTAISKEFSRTRERHVDRRALRSARLALGQPRPPL